jgi:hypothetical protein
LGFFAGFYGPNSDCGRSYLWEELAGLFNWWNFFNVARFPNERLGKALPCPAMVEFSNFIFDQGLMDLPFVGGSFLWSKNLDPPSWSRIDKVFFVYMGWEAKYLDLS